MMKLIDAAHITTRVAPHPRVVEVARGAELLAPHDGGVVAVGAIHGARHNMLPPHGVVHAGPLLRAAVVESRVELQEALTNGHTHKLTYRGCVPTDFVLVDVAVAIVVAVAGEARVTQHSVLLLELRHVVFHLPKYKLVPLHTTRNGGVVDVEIPLFYGVESSVIGVIVASVFGGVDVGFLVFCGGQEKSENQNQKQKKK